MTAKGQVLALLSRGWTPTRRLTDEVHGDPLRRLRELRAEGVPIEQRKVLVHGHWRTEYRVVGDAAQAPGQLGLEL